MKSITIKKLYKLHTWVGIITGILLFVIAFSGAVAVFARPELQIWANSAIREPIPINPEQYHATLATLAQKVGPEYLDEVHVNFPRARSAETARVIFEGHVLQPDGTEKHEGFVFELSPKDLRVIEKFDMETYFSTVRFDMASFIAHFHADLHLGRPVGLILTGLLGLTLMVSIITGILIHRKKLAQIFTFRPDKSFSLLLSDGHKVMGIWGVAFHSVIAFTGAFLGLATVILVPAAAYVGFNGDQEKLVETFTAIKAPEISHVQQETQISEILSASKETRTDLTLTNFTVMGYGDKEALVYVFGTGSEQLGGETLVYQGATGEYLRSQANFGRLEGVTGKILDAMFPLHFGNFAGIFVKVIWAWLGLAMALLPISGIMLWQQRGIAAKNPSHSKRTYELVGRLLSGTCTGIVLATSVLFPVQLVCNHIMPSADETYLIFTAFFGVWGGATLLGLFVRAKHSFRLLGMMSALCLVSVMPLDIAFTGSHLFNVSTTHHNVSVGVDLTLFMLGLLSFYYLFYKGKTAGSIESPLIKAEGNK
ncbi:PepSY domain-containing protein [Aestuariibacter sp. A3R04]|uniref:PepSY-associated TM helix domain-containing protein n=1 Tax=Aestuariibacter sp. A3R04 TaxID=2841571 RepID=UPI001C0964F2|nr:PepSY-associated TM helix domain-containing protein [Aestuariibacter sp. A3R04]MBU3021646.1 PepSY domain-containing protein [Aestuariibacter sp. A3R04]